MDKISILIYVIALICALLILKIYIDAKKRSEEKNLEKIRKKEISIFTEEEVADSSIQDYLLGKLKSSKLKKFSYDYIYDFLRANGKIDGVAKSTTPEGYMLVKLILAFGFFLIACLLEWYVVALPALVIGFYIEDFSIKSTNKRDNQKMAGDISNIYSKLAMQLGANIYITSTFYDCYYYATNKRLKKALLELNAGVEVTHDLKACLEDFQSKFNNESIDTLVVIIKQAIVSGNTVDYLNSIKKETSRVNVAELYTYKERMTRKLGACAVSIFGFTVIILVYALITIFSSNLGGFFTITS